jgi:hypothetical protein
MQRARVGRRWSSRMNLKPLAALCLCLPLGACVSASVSNGTASTSSGVAPMQHPMLEGIPIPNGFELVPERSYYRNTGSQRYATCEYQGPTDPLAVSRFYREYMPTAGFAFRQERYIGGQRTMEFESSTEQSTVCVKPDKSRTVLIIEISPAAKAPADRETAPPSPKRPP